MVVKNISGRDYGSKVRKRLLKKWSVNLKRKKLSQANNCPGDIVLHLYSDEYLQFIPQKRRFVRFELPILKVGNTKSQHYLKFTNRLHLKANSELKFKFSINMKQTANLVLIFELIRNVWFDYQLERFFFQTKWLALDCCSTENSLSTTRKQSGLPPLS